LGEPGGNQGDPDGFLVAVDYLRFAFALAVGSRSGESGIGSGLIRPFANASFTLADLALTAEAHPRVIGAGRDYKEKGTNK